MAKITMHGEKRIRKRNSIPSKSVDGYLEKVVNEGKKHSDCKGQLKKFLDAQAKVHKGKPLIYSGSVYWFYNDTLITTYPLPGRFKKYL